MLVVMIRQRSIRIDKSIKAQAARSQDLASEPQAGCITSACIRTRIRAYVHARTEIFRGAEDDGGER
jgi:hypothetical protein